MQKVRQFKNGESLWRFRVGFFLTTNKRLHLGTFPHGTGGLGIFFRTPGRLIWIKYPNKIKKKKIGNYFISVPIRMFWRHDSRERDRFLKKSSLCPGFGSQRGLCGIIVSIERSGSKIKIIIILYLLYYTIYDMNFILILQK